MDILPKKTDCSGCKACAQACPKNCIKMIEDEEGFWYPQIDRSSCISCNACVRACPILNRTEEGKETSLNAYAAYHHSENIRRKSSSGGVFTALAEEIFRRGGTVYGAAMTEDCHSVKHIAAHNMEELSKLQQSKYVQSDIAQTFREAKAELENGRWVLFSGTPCQIEGLKCFLGKEYERLYTQDIICHGVPSPKIWRKYLLLREQQAKDTAQSVSFRDKIYGWREFSCKLVFRNGCSASATLETDLFLRAFLLNVSLRPSCSQCHFKKIHRISDITLADFWGVEKVIPSMDDNKGTSLVVVHSEKGRKLFQAVAQSLIIQKVDAWDALQYNQAMTHSALANDHRKDFFAHADCMPFNQLVRFYAKPKFCLRSWIRGKAKSFVRLLTPPEQVMWQDE